MEQVTVVQNRAIQLLELSEIYYDFVKTSDFDCQSLPFRLATNISICRWLQYKAGELIRRGRCNP